MPRYQADDYLASLDKSVENGKRFKPQVTLPSGLKVEVTTYLV